MRISEEGDSLSFFYHEGFSESVFTCIDTFSACRMHELASQFDCDEYIVWIHLVIFEAWIS